MMLQLKFILQKLASTLNPPPRGLSEGRSSTSKKMPDLKLKLKLAKISCQIYLGGTHRSMVWKVKMS